MIESRRNGRRAVFLLLICAAMLAGSVPATAATPTAPPAGGFLVELAPDDAPGGRLRVQGLIAAAPPPPRTDAARAGDWQLRLLDGHGAEIGRWAVPDPDRREPGDPFLQTARQVRFPDLPQAVLAELFDDAGVLRAEVPLDVRGRAVATAAHHAIRQRLAAAAPGPRRPISAARRAAIRQADDAAARGERQRQLCQQRPPVWRAPELIRSANRCAPPSLATRTPPPPRPLPRRPQPLLLRAAGAGTAAPTARAAIAVPGRPQAIVDLTGRIDFADGGPLPSGFFTVWVNGADGNPDSWTYHSVGPPAFEFVTPVTTGVTFSVLVESPVPYIKVAQLVGPFNAAATQEITLEVGAVLSGRLNYQGPAPSGGGDVLMWGGDATGYGWSAPIDEEHRFEFAVLPGSAPTLDVNPSAPYLAGEFALGPILTDVSRDFRIERGLALTAIVVEPGSIGGSSSLAIADFANGTMRTLSIGGGQVATLGIPAYGGTVDAYRGGRRGSAALVTRGQGDLFHEFTIDPLPPSANLGLLLRDSHARPLHQARVEVWRDGAFLTSVLTQAGATELRLMPGAYRLRVWPDTEEAAGDHQAPVKLFAEPVIVADVVLTETRQDLQFDASPAAWVDLKVRLPTNPPWPACANAAPGSWAAVPYGRLELLRNDTVVARDLFRGFYYADQQVQPMAIGGGQWRLRYTGPGEKTWTSEPFVAAEGVIVNLREDSPVPARVWRGTLRDHLGAPVAGRGIGLSDELGIGVFPTCPATTDAQGRFTLPLCDGCVYEFRGAGTDPAQRRIVRASGVVSGDRLEDVALGEPLEFAPLPVGGQGRVFGAADAPFRLVFLAEGYAQERETFTDTNGNGVWDGYHFVDFNNDGLWDANEPYARYGNRPAPPLAGVNLRLGNEPFVDENGDGVLSLDDAALFERNVQDYLRGLFSNHQFAQYRGAYQAQAQLAYSAQVGMDHPGVQQRDTLFNARYVVDRGLIDIDYSTASIAAADADPAYTAVVVMINHPVPYGRVNAFILADGGPLAGDVNDTVSGHEFGHNPGGLADEYSEFPAEYFGGTPSGFHNVARFVQRDQVAWGAHVPAPMAGAPTRPWMAASGFYAGAQYHASGIYRPSPSSMMRFMDSLLFNAASVDRLRRVHADALRGRPGRLAVTSGSCSRHALTWDVVATGATRVQLRAGDPEGAVLAKGGAIGTASVKPAMGDVFLVDADDGMVLDVEALPILRCANGGR